MDARLRKDRVFPNVSGQTLSGAMTLLAVFGFGAAALPSLLSQAMPGANPLTEPPSSVALIAAPVSAPGPDREPPSRPSTGSEPAQAAPAMQSVSRPGNRPPVIRRVDFAGQRVTRLGDLRLQIEVWDPDGDPVTVRTTWTVDGREVDTRIPVLERSLFSRGAHIQAAVVALDGIHESQPFFTREIVVANAPPLMTTFPKGFDATGSFVYPMGAIDLDGDRGLEFHLIEGPPGMRIEAHDGTLTWRPGSDQGGRHSVRVEVRDGHGGHESQSFELDVRRPVPAPSALAER